MLVPACLSLCLWCCAVTVRAEDSQVDGRAILQVKLQAEPFHDANDGANLSAVSLHWRLVSLSMQNPGPGQLDQIGFQALTGPVRKLEAKLAAGQKVAVDGGFDAVFAILLPGIDNSDINIDPDSVASPSRAGQTMTATVTTIFAIADPTAVETPTQMEIVLLGNNSDFAQKTGRLTFSDFIRDPQFIASATARGLTKDDFASLAPASSTAIYFYFASLGSPPATSAPTDFSRPVVNVRYAKALFEPCLTAAQAWLRMGTRYQQAPLSSGSLDAATESLSQFLDSTYNPDGLDLKLKTSAFLVQVGANASFSHQDRTLQVLILNFNQVPQIAIAIPTIEIDQQALTWDQWKDEVDKAKSEQATKTYEKEQQDANGIKSQFETSLQQSLTETYGDSGQLNTPRYYANPQMDTWRNSFEDGSSKRWVGQVSWTGDSTSRTFNVPYEPEYASLKAGASYNVTDGLGGSISGEYRSLFTKTGLLTLNGTAAVNSRSAALDYGFTDMGLKSDPFQGAFDANVSYTKEDSLRLGRSPKIGEEETTAGVSQTFSYDSNRGPGNANSPDDIQVALCLNPQYRFTDLSGPQPFVGTPSSGQSPALEVQVPVDYTRHLGDPQGRAGLGDLEVHFVAEGWQTFKFLDGDFDYTKYGGQISVTQRGGWLSNQDVFLRLTTGVGGSDGAVPLFDDYRLGGDQIVRGLEEGEFIGRNYTYDSVVLGMNVGTITYMIEGERYTDNTNGNAGADTGKKKPMPLPDAIHYQLAGFDLANLYVTTFTESGRVGNSSGLGDTVSFHRDTRDYGIALEYNLSKTAGSPAPAIDAGYAWSPESIRQTGRFFIGVTVSIGN